MNKTRQESDSSDEGSIFTLDDWNAEIQGSTETHSGKKRPWWHPDHKDYDENDDGPHWPTVFSRESWINELRQIKDLNQTDRISQIDEEISRFKALYNENAVPTMKEGLDLEGILSEVEKGYARIGLLYECIDYDTDLKLSYLDIGKYANSARKYQAQLIKQQHDLHEQHNKTSGSNASVLSFSFEERCVQAIDEELIQFIKNPNNPRWQKEKEEMNKGYTVPRAVEMRRYLVDIALLNKFTKENEERFSELISDLGIRVVESLQSVWKSRLADDNGENTILIAIANAVTHTLNMFSSGSEDHSPKQPVRHMEINCNQQPTEPEPSSNICEPIRNMMSNQNINSNKVSDWVASSPQPKDATCNEQTKVSSEQPPTEHNNILLQVTNVLKNVADELAKSKSPNNVHGSAVKLPGIDIWQFDGNPLNFQDWYLRYKSVIHNSDKLSPSNKLIYLSQYLTKSAQEKCWGPHGGLNVLNYDQAHKYMLEIFADKDQLLGLCLNKIAQQNFPRNENDISGIRSVANTTRKVIDTLEKLEIPSIAYSQATMVKFMERLPMQVQIKMMENLKNDSFLQIPLTDLIAEMNRYCKIRERTTTYLEYRQTNNETSTQNPGTYQEFSTNNERHDQYNNFNQRTTMSTQVNSPHQQPSNGDSYQTYQRTFGKCIFCDHRGGMSGHKWKDCPVVTDPVKRYEKFRQLQLCLACGSPRHIVKHCQSSWRCGEERAGKCSQKHHRSLHHYFQQNRRNAQSNNDSAPQQQAQQQANNLRQQPNQTNEPLTPPR